MLRRRRTFWYLKVCASVYNFQYEPLQVQCQQFHLIQKLLKDSFFRSNRGFINFKLLVLTASIVKSLVHHNAILTATCIVRLDVTLWFSFLMRSSSSSQPKPVTWATVGYLYLCMFRMFIVKTLVPQAVLAHYSQSPSQDLTFKHVYLILILFWHCLGLSSIRWHGS